jgi:hypothetical protein
MSRCRPAARNLAAYVSIYISPPPPVLHAVPHSVCTVVSRGVAIIVGCDSRKRAIIHSKRKIVSGSTFITRRAGK